MPLQKILFKPGVNRENTRYTNEGGYYESEKIRFRQGTPEKIGGWVQISTNTFLGVCRSLWNWATLASQNLLGVGTNLKFYIENGGAYYDITPTKPVQTLSNPFATVLDSNIVTVTDPSGGFVDGDFVTFTGANIVGGILVAGEYELTLLSATTYTITTTTFADTTVIAGGGSSVYAVYQIDVGASISVPTNGWGAGPWGYGTWGNGTPTINLIRLWNQNNFGQNLVYGTRGGALYYWDAKIGYSSTTVTFNIATSLVTASVSPDDLTPIIFTTDGALPTGLLVGTIYYTRYVTSNTFNLSLTPTGSLITLSGSQSGVHRIATAGIEISNLTGANETPLSQTFFLVSDSSRFIICFGTNDVYSTIFDPMLVRWSNQNSVTEWAPSATNQAGSVRLSHGSKIVTALQSRQEIIIWTDSSLYSLQYLGPPYVWGNQLLSDNVSIAGPNSMAIASGVTYWMGVDKFYKYDGSVQTLRCDLRQYIYGDINTNQFDQIYAGTNEGFNEVWWFYCSANSDAIDKYVIYNYLEDVWYYGTMARTAWLDTGLRNYPLAATYSNNIVTHENGVNDNTSGTPQPIEAYILSSEFDIGDGHNFGFVWRILPDLTFRGSTSESPSVKLYLYPLQNSGSGYNDPTSLGGSNYGTVTRSAVYPVEQYTGQIFTRVRGRQLAFKIQSTEKDVTWQLGAPRIDIRPDGRR
jgi:hypothetical protein